VLYLVWVEQCWLYHVWFVANQSCRDTCLIVRSQMSVGWQRERRTNAFNWERESGWLALAAEAGGRRRGACIHHPHTRSVNTNCDYKPLIDRLRSSAHPLAPALPARPTRPLLARAAGRLRPSGRRPPPPKVAAHGAVRGSKLPPFAHLRLGEWVQISCENLSQSLQKICELQTIS
jgi:hypothetical protein